MNVIDLTQEPQQMPLTMNNVISIEEEDDDQDEKEEDRENWVHLATATSSDCTGCRIVGIRYYTGEAHPGEFVNLIREPHNPYDHNAIRVDNMHGQKVGHIKRELAATLSGIMDRHAANLVIDASIPGRGTSYDLPLQLDFRGKDISLAETIEDALQRHRLPKKAAAKTQQQPIVHRRTLDWKEQQKQLDDMFQQQKDQLQNLPPITVPPQLTATLFPHQIQGVQWLAQRERQTDVSTSPFYKQVKERGKALWLCEITNASQKEAPPVVRGGILADDMGLGKTIQTIALILCNPPMGRDYSKPLQAQATTIASDTRAASLKTPTKSALKSLPLAKLQQIASQLGMFLDGKKEKIASLIVSNIEAGTITLEQYYHAATQTSTSSSGTSITTLIVCPVSVMGNWRDQIDAHVAPGTLHVAMYHGENREDLLSSLDNIDILISSYNTLQYDFSKYKKESTEGKPASSKRQKTGKSIFDSQFHRIVLDEAHIIRNSNSKTFQACTAVRAERRICLTGTPLQNKPEDIHALFEFLNVPPLADKNIFRRSISQPIKDGDDSGLAILRTMMAHVSLRRNKDTADIKLPEKHVELREVEFIDGNKHKEIHDTIYKAAKHAFQASLGDNGRDSRTNHFMIFEVLTRLRQACCSGKLVPAERLKVAEQVLSIVKDKKTLTLEEGKELLEKLKGALEQKEDVPPECAICFDQMSDNAAIVLRTCGHVFCETCINRVATGYHSNCPFCRKTFDKDQLISWTEACAAADSSKIVEKSLCDQQKDIDAPPKLVALSAAIDEMQPGEKGVIFSQFTKFLDEIQLHLVASNVTFTRVDGSMAPVMRIEAIKSFSQENGGPQIILCSLHAAGTGVNLTRANHIFMMDTWWNKAVEQQAMDRVHRIGQERNVRVLRFVAANSIESRMVELQEAKAAIGKGAFENLSKEEKKRARLEDVKKLFEIH